MKKILLANFLVLYSFAFSQSTTNNNTWANNKYLGYDFSNFANPLFTKTNGINRMRLNGNQNTLINFVNQNTSGYLGIAPSGYFTNNSPWSMLHLEGPNNVPQFTGGQWRSWMKTGLFMRENSDAMYVGLKQEPGNNRSDAIVSWSDDMGTDRLRFLFTATSLNGNGDIANPLSASSFEGYEFMRMESSGPINHVGTLSGHVAIGPQFTPRNRLHMNAESALPNYLQISSTNSPLVQGTGNTALDGLKFGIQPIISNGAPRQTAFLQWQENTPFIVQTDWDNTAGGVAQGERLRVTSVGALVNTQGLTYGGITNPTNITRIAISHNGSNPITKPLSLLHLGYNTGANASGPSTDGWRKWMDIGTFISDGTDNMYVGLKREGPDRADAIINWGDNQVAGITPNGPDKLRFIFTSTTTAFPPGQGDPVSQSNSGLETMRIVPFRDTTFTYLDTVTNYGRVGIGDFTVLGVNEEPTHKLDVVGNGRFRFLPDSLYFADSTVNKIVMVDSMGVLRWASSVPGQFGVPCGDTVNGKLFSDTKEDLNNHNFYFTKNDSLGVNHFGVGYACGDILPGKISSLQTHPSIISLPGTQTFAGHFLNTDTSNTFKTLFAGVYGEANGYNMLDGSLNLGGLFYASSARQSVGVAGIGAGGAYSVGVYGQASGGTYVNYAGYFEGDVYVNGGATSGSGYLIASDQQFKNDVNNFSNGLEILEEISPKTYYLDTNNNYGINFPGTLQYGMIAQDVEQVLPSLVSEITKPARYDSLGNMLTQEITYKSLNYNAFIPILISAVKEQDEKIDAQDEKIDSLNTVVGDLNNRLTQLENCLSGILPFLCQLSNSSIQQTPEMVQEQIRTAINVNLSDKNTIILDQNVPNPFAESTIITYSIPATVGKAQIHFYDLQGKLIKVVDINERGAGQLNVFGEDLSSGTYTYTLVADGQIVSTKKMVKE